jgi:hypothetical protein
VGLAALAPFLPCRTEVRNVGSHARQLRSGEPRTSPARRPDGRGIPVPVQSASRHRPISAGRRLALLAGDAPLRHQAVLDEYAHLLWEPAAWSNANRNTIAGQVTTDAVKAITTKTSTVRPDYYRTCPERIEPVPEGAALRTHFALRYGTARSSDGAHEVREDAVRDAFKSPFCPFVLASTSVGQEGLDFHPWCHSVWHWNLPGNPVDLEQREGRVHRYKGHAVRKNVAERHGRALLQQWSPGQDPWEVLFETATKSRAPGESELIPCWLSPGAHKVERFVPLLPLSREEEQLERLKRNLAIYRVVFGQPRQAELMASIDGGGISQSEIDSWAVRLEPASRVAQ